MTIIKTTDTGETYELAFDFDGNLAETTQWQCDEDYAWHMPKEEAEWWQDWADRQERIEAAISEADDATADAARAIYVDEKDYETAQRKACAVLGINYGSRNLYSITEAAEALGVSRQRVHALIQSGRIDAEKVGSTWVVYRYSVNAILAGRR